MINEVLFLAITVSFTWALAPRFFRLCDVVLARRRLGSGLGDGLGNGLGFRHTEKPPAAHPTDLPHRFTQLTSTDDFLSARGFNELARLTRAHLPLNDAVQHLSSSSSSDAWKLFATALDRQQPAETVLADLAVHFPASQSIHLLKAAVNNGNFVPMALDQAAMAIRDRERTQGEITVATAQAQLTIRILTTVPIVLLTLGIIAGDSFRHIVLTPAVLSICLIALVVNRVGALWSSLLIRRLHRPTTTDEILLLISVLSVNIRAGLSLPSACQQLRDVSLLGDLISHSLHKEDAFEEALQPLHKLGDRFADDVAALLIAAYRDGQPALETIGVLSHEARQHREQQTQVLIRKLPTQLTAPVVLCVLPSFIMLVVVPMIVAQLSSLSVVLST